MTRLVCALCGLACLLCLAACPQVAGENKADGKKSPTRHHNDASEQAYPVLPPADEQRALAEGGMEQFRKHGCINCHVLDSERSVLSGPSLMKVAADYLAYHKGDELAARRALFSHIRDPHQFPGLKAKAGLYRSGIMPAHSPGQINDDNLRKLVEMLMTRR